MDKDSNESYVVFEPELMNLVTQIVCFNVEAGAKSIVEVAERVIADVGDKIRPYIKGAYKNVHMLPGVEQITCGMDSDSVVDEFDVFGFDKKDVVAEEPVIDESMQEEYACDNEPSCEDEFDSEWGARIKGLSNKQKKKVRDLENHLKKCPTKKWALMRLQLMEEYKPAELQELLKTGRLEQSLEETNEQMIDKDVWLFQDGHYNSSDIQDILRNELLEEYVYSQQTEYTGWEDEALDKIAEWEQENGIRINRLSHDDQMYIVSQILLITDEEAEAWLDDMENRGITL